MKSISTINARATIYILIDNLESDLKDILIQGVNYADSVGLSSEEIFGKDLIGKLIQKLNSKQEDITNQSLVDELCLGDEIDLLSILNKYFTEATKSFFDRETISELKKISPIRNRVYHPHLLEVSDFPVTIDSVQYLRNKQQAEILLPNLVSIIGRLEDDPGIVLGIKVPEDSNRSVVQNNLPIPDFEDTGFIGRSDDVKRIINACYNGPYPVLSIIGDGGLGKTALALRVAYSIINDPDCPFELVIWVSSKTTRISNSEFEQIANAIRTSKELFSAISDYLYQGSENTVENILEYMREFKILLIIDNLETILDKDVNDFLLNIPGGGSKILITSRIGLGGAVLPIKLPPMNSGEASKLLRSYSRFRGVSRLVGSNTTEEEVKDYCAKMGNNPGFIKWFVSTVYSGKTPEEVFASSELFLNFCMSNVYNYLSSSTIDILNVMQYSLKQLNLSEIAFLSAKNPDVVKMAVQQLISTNMVFMLRDNDTQETLFCISEFAKSYLDKTHPLNVNKSRRIQTRINKLHSSMDGQSSNTFKYSINYIATRSPRDTVSALQLKNALNALKAKHLKEALEIVEKQRSLNPGYFEVQRVYAQVKAAMGASSEAREAFEAALSLIQNQPQLFCHYGLFVSSTFNDHVFALSLFDKAINCSFNDFDPFLNKLRMLLFLKKYDEAEQTVIIIKEKCPLSSRQKTILMEQELSLSYRKVDYAISQNESIERILILFEQLFHQYRNVFFTDRTQRMKELLRWKADRSIDRLLSRKNNSNYEQINELVTEWLILSQENSNFIEGRIKDYDYQTNTGVIVDNNHQVFSFKRQNILEKNSYEVIDSRSIVRFIPRRFKEEVKALCIKRN